MSNLEALKNDAKGFSVLYAEADKKLRDMASAVFKKIFTDVYVASDGEEAYALYKKYHPNIIITDTEISTLNGLELSKKIKKINLDAKIIIMSIHDKKEYLFEAIKIGAFDYLKKPVNLSTLTNSIHLAIKYLKYNENKKIFYTHIKSVYNYKNSMIALLKDNKPIIANSVFLNFFEVDSTKEFISKYPDLGALFLVNKHFLYNQKEKNWIKEIEDSDENLYNVKLVDKENNPIHFMFKYEKIKDKEGYALISFDDVSDLNLGVLFNGNELEEGKYCDAMLELLKVIKRNNAKINLHNYYKGLSITNEAFLLDMQEDSITIQTNYMQQKTIQSEKKAILVSKALPRPIICEDVSNIGFKTQSVEFKNAHFINTSPTTRKTIRITPEPDHSVSLILHKHRVKGDVIIEDISVDAIKLRLSLVPSLIKEGDTAILDMVLHINNKPLIINTKVTVFRMTKVRHGLEVVLMYNLSEDKRKKLVEYVTKRLVYIIKEFKKIQDG